MGGRVAILGYGRFGHALSLLLLDAGVEVRSFDPAAEVPADLAARDLEHLVEGARFVVLAVPLAALADAIRDVLPVLDPERHIVLDVTPTKGKSIEVLDKALGDRVPWVSTHPLFGAASIASAERPLPVMVCRNEKHAAATEDAASLFRDIGCQVHLFTAEEHDAFIARTHALLFFVVKGLSAIGMTHDESLIAPSLRGIVRALRLVQGQEDDVLYTLSADVVQCATSRGAFISALADIDRELSAARSSGDRESVPTPRARATESSEDLAGRSPVLQETRNAIDDIDREILGLLARRGRLALRARDAKKELGRSVLDAQREANLVRDRRAWAIQERLEPDAIERVFASILAFSRGLQRKG